MVDQIRMIDEEHAEGRVRDIYQDISRTLGTPFGADCFKAFATHPDFLEEVWRETKPALAHPALFGLADRVRAHALACARRRFFVPDHSTTLMDRGLGEQQIERIREDVEFFYVIDPKLLVITNLVKQSLASFTSSRAFEPQSPSDFDILSFPKKAKSANRSSAVVEEIREGMDVPFVPVELRVLAERPEYLEMAWGDLKAQIRATEFRRRVGEISDIAAGGAQVMPVGRISSSSLRKLNLKPEQMAQICVLAQRLSDSSARMVGFITLLRLGLNASLLDELLSMEAGG